MASSGPRVSIGMAVYNGKNFIRQAIASIRSQTYTDFELIIADNASTDGTPEICAALAAEDVRLRVHRNPRNLGASLNHSQLVDMAQGEYFKWAAHDDVLEPTFLERCVDALDRDPGAVLCHPRTRIIDAEGQFQKDLEEDLGILGDSPHARLAQFLGYYSSPMECNAVFGLMRRGVLRETGRIGNYPASDMVLLGEMAMHGPYHQVPERLFLRRDHRHTSVRANRDWTRRAEWFDPKNRNRVQLPVWRWTREYARCIERVPMSAQEHLRCHRELLRWCAGNRRAMGRELISLPRWLLSRWTA